MGRQEPPGEYESRSLRALAPALAPPGMALEGRRSTRLRLIVLDRPMA